MVLYQFINRAHMDNFQEIRRRFGNPPALTDILVHGVYLRIADFFLSYVDPRAPGVSAYRARLGLGVARTDRPEPAGPS